MSFYSGSILLLLVLCLIVPINTLITSRTRIAPHSSLVREFSSSSFPKSRPHFELNSNSIDSLVLSNHENNAVYNSSFYFHIDKQIANIAVPAFVSLVADPLASMVDALYIGRLGPAEQAGMGISIAAHYAISKLYNDPLLKTSTSLVAGKTNQELSASVSSAMIIAVVIGILQTFIFILSGSRILTMMNVPVLSDMRKPALDYLKWRALGVPASTALLVGIGIFRGRGDTKTPLYCTSFGSLINIILDPIFIFTFKMGCAGAGAATAISQWCTAIPLLYYLNKSTKFLDYYSTSNTAFYDENNDKLSISKLPTDIDQSSSISKKLTAEETIQLKTKYLKNAFSMYFNAGGLILVRTLAKVSAYAVTSSYAASLGTISMAAYALTFNLGFATSQLCESISVAAQSLLARELPYDTEYKQVVVKHIMQRTMLLGILVSSSLSIFTYFNMNNVLSAMAKSVEVQKAAMHIMPVVLITQLFKGLAYSSGGILLGGRDWSFSTLSMIISSIICIVFTKYLPILQPPSLYNIWITLSSFMAAQVMVAVFRVLSRTGPWKNINLLSNKNTDSRST